MLIFMALLFDFEGLQFSKFQSFLKKTPPNSKAKKNSREFSYTFFIGSCTPDLCGNTDLHTTHLWKHKKLYVPNAKLWKHKIAKCNFVFTQSWVILTCVGLFFRNVYTQDFFISMFFVPLNHAGADIFMCVSLISSKPRMLWDHVRLFQHFCFFCLGFRWVFFT